MTVPQRPISDLMVAENSSPVPGFDVMPMACVRSCTSGVASAFRKASCKVLTIAAGVLAGTRKPKVECASKLGKPDSTMVGTSGRVDTRARDMTACARRSPCCTSGITSAWVAK
jgi:hypothetical protein